MPSDLPACHSLIEGQASELEKLRKLLSRLVNGNKSERRVLNNPGQQLLPFESEAEYEAAKAEAELEAKQIVDEYKVKNHEPERPTGLVEGNRYSPSVAAAVVDYKWGHYLPLYRQQDLFAASGWTPRRSTRCNLVEATEFAVDPLLDLMKSRAQHDMAVGLDDTSCRMLLPKVDPPADPADPKSVRLAAKLRDVRSKGHKSLHAKMWVYSGLCTAPYHVFDFRVSRHRDGPDEFFRESRCYVQGDCFSGNTSVVMQSDGRLEFVACWAHARRKVAEAKTYKESAEQLLGMLQALYDIETRAKEYSPDQRKRLLSRESVQILDTIHIWLDSPVVYEALPKSDFGEALRYIRNHWQALSVYVRDGRLPIDNNAVEQLMKQVALGRKAWLFVSNVAGGERSAKMMSLVSSARRHDLDSRLYIQDILIQLLAGSTDYVSMLPDVWKQSHPEAIRAYRQEERRDKADRKQLHAARRRLLRQNLTTSRRSCTLTALRVFEWLDFAIIRSNILFP